MSSLLSSCIFLSLLRRSKIYFRLMCPSLRNKIFTLIKSGTLILSFKATNINFFRRCSISLIFTTLIFLSWVEFSAIFSLYLGTLFRWMNCSSTNSALYFRFHSSISLLSLLIYSSNFCFTLKWDRFGYYIDHCIPGSGTTIGCLVHNH